MSSKRKLVSRARQNEVSSPAQRGRPRNSDADAAGEAPPLPQYQPPCCPLSVTAIREIDALCTNHDVSKYKKHVKASISTLTNSAVESNDRLFLRKQRLEKLANKRRQQGMDDEEKGEEEIESEKFTSLLEKKVDDVTEKAEKALRDLIDYQREIEMQDSILTSVKEKINAAPRRQNRANDLDGYDDDDEGQDGNNPSALDIFKKAKEESSNSYASKSMLDRYDTNDYRNFKRTVHDALHPGPDAPPLPHARTWFAEDMSAATPRSRRRRQANTTDNNNNGSDEDDEVVIARVTNSLKCPLTLRQFEEPFSNNVCNHTFEKQAIVDYINDEGVAFGEASQRRGRGAQPIGPKRVKCPQTGCDAMFEIKDFYDDGVIRRQIKRQQRQDAAAELEDDEEEYSGPQGTQGSRAEGADDDADATIDIDAERRRTITKVKAETGRSRGLRIAPSRRHVYEEEREEGEDENEEMEA